VPDFITISAHSIGVGDPDSHQIADVAFTTDLTTATTQLTAAIGTEPTVIPVPATSCNAATSIYDWGGLQIAFDPYMTDIGGHNSSPRSLNPRPPAGWNLMRHSTKWSG